jgi:Ser/Thr protein kinase RdoA (MazF antagonist)
MAIASRFGLRVTAPVRLADSNNVIVWLAPTPVVAKVGTGHHHALSLELRGAQHLVRMGAPVVSPATELPQQVHHVGGFVATFWQYRRHDGTEVHPEILAMALAALHEALATYPGTLPSFEEELHRVGQVLSQPQPSPALDETDRNLLLAALDRFQMELASCATDRRPLHGSPHRSNVLVVRGRPQFIDFETVCQGPLEWDLAHAAPEVVAAYPGGFDSEVHAWCAALVSVKTAAWCWARIDHPHLRWHAEHHLGVVKTLML